MEYSITGLVMNSSNDPIPAVTIMIIAGPGEWPDLGILSDDNGQFELSGLFKPGNYRLLLTSISGAQKEVEVEVKAETTNIEVVLE
ncbi:MAG: carboxypeptidase-like regulatory domain-containing protein [Bacteroidota bacterium]